jgi:cytidylate kinase
VIITIDGPAGSGKSTTARAVADRLDYVYLDTGAMYRAVALAVLEHASAPLQAALREESDTGDRDGDREVGPQEVRPREAGASATDNGEASAGGGATDARLEAFLDTLRLHVRYRGNEQRVFLNGADVSARIREPEVGAMASRVSERPAVRQKLVEAQRAIGRQHEEDKGGVVLDGRDTGTVVFPEAEVKIYMDADLDERARRRREEYRRQGEAISLEAVRQEIRRRDRQDRERDLAPLRRADDAILLDTTDRTVEEQVDFVVGRVKEQKTQGT